MFARVITIQTQNGKLDEVIEIIQQMRTLGREIPGWEGLCMTSDAQTSKGVIISLWKTREAMDNPSAAYRALAQRMDTLLQVPATREAHAVNFWDSP